MEPQTLYCAVDREREGPMLCSFYGHPKSVRVAERGLPIVKVTVHPDDDGRYYAWWRYETEAFEHVYPSAVQLKMCFPYGPEVNEEEGRGKRQRVSVELDELIDDQGHEVTLSELRAIRPA